MSGIEPFTNTARRPLVPIRQKKVAFVDQAADDNKKRQVKFAMEDGHYHNDESGYPDHGSSNPHKKMKEATLSSQQELRGSRHDHGSSSPGRHCDSYSPFDNTTTLATVSTDDDGGGEVGQEVVLEVTEEGSKDNDEQSQEEEEMTDDEEKAKWDEFVEEKRARGETKNCEGLDIYLKGRQKWEDAASNLSNKVLKFEAETTRIADSVCNNVIANVHLQKQYELNELSETCKSRLTSNEQRRKDMLKKLQEANKAWNATYKGLVARTLDETEDSETVGEDNNDDVWNDFIHDCNPERTVEVTQLYDAAQQRLQDAEERFKDSLNTTIEGWKDRIQSSIDEVVQIHGQQFDEIRGVGKYIQTQMMANHDRGISYTKQLEEANDARQSFFSRLLQQVTSTKTSNANKATT